MVLGKLSVLGHPTSLDYSRTRAYCTCRRVQVRLFNWTVFLSSIISLSISLSLGDGPIQTKILSQRAV